MNLKSKKVQQYWGKDSVIIDYSKVDQSIIKEFKGTHPEIIVNWLPKSNGIFQADYKYTLNKKEKRHRKMKRIESIFKLDFSKKHFKLVK